MPVPGFLHLHLLRLLVLFLILSFRFLLLRRESESFTKPQFPFNELNTSPLINFG
jgi:hypothetical protein